MSVRGRLGWLAPLALLAVGAACGPSPEQPAPPVGTAVGFSDEQVREFIVAGHANPELLPEILNIAAEMTEEEKQRQKAITEALGDDYVERSREQMVALGLEAELGDRGGAGLVCSSEIAEHGARLPLRNPS